MAEKQRFTRVPVNAFKKIVINAGILATDFNTERAEVAEENLLGATSGGISFSATPTFKDYGEDIDNCPANTKELKRIDSIDTKISGTMVTIDALLAKKLAVAADETNGKIVPRDFLEDEDFSDIWLIGDYTGDDGTGFIAVRLINALNTGGLQITTQNKAKGQFVFEFTGHYSLADTTVVPYELYIMKAVA